MTSSLMKLSPNELHNKLTKKHGSPLFVEQMKTSILEAKAKQRVDKITRYQHAKVWGELISPLKYELSNAKVGLKHEGKFKEERDQAFTAYIALMEKLLMKLEALSLETYDLQKRDGTIVTKRHTPSTIATDLERDGKGLPNHGLHWTDWIPTSKRTQIATLFEQIPYAPKTKRKIPFQRIQRPNTKQKQRLLQRTQKELELEERDYMIDPSVELMAKIDKIKYAIKIINELKPTDIVPRTWHGLSND